MQPQFDAISKYFKNICYLNKTRKIVTKACCNKSVKDKEHNEVNVKYSGKVESYKVAAGMPVLVTQNLKKKCMFNMIEFTIDEIDDYDTSFKINDIWFELNDFRQNFIPAFCSTVY